MGNSIIVVCLNPAIDKTFVLDRFIESGTNAVNETIIRPGGKGINVALALKNLGVDFMTTGILVGSGGRYIKKFLADNAINEDFIDLPGDMRTNYKIYRRDTGSTTELNERGQLLTIGHFEDFLENLAEMTEGCRILVLSGSLPPGFPDDAYLRIIGMAHTKDIKVILDANGKILRDTVYSIPFAIKPNKDEFEDLTGKKFNSIKEIVYEAKKIADKGISYCIVSLGKDGAVVSTGCRTIYAQSYDIVAVSPVGAGDSMVAAFVYCMTEGMDLEMTVRYMVAVSTVSASMDLGLYSTAENARKALEKIKIKEF
jgi:1-phosphofructokinase